MNAPNHGGNGTATADADRLASLDRVLTDEEADRLTEAILGPVERAETEKTVDFVLTGLHDASRLARSAYFAERHDGTVVHYLNDPPESSEVPTLWWVFATAYARLVELGAVPSPETGQGEAIGGPRPRTATKTGESVAPPQRSPGEGRGNMGVVGAPDASPDGKGPPWGVSFAALRRPIAARNPATPGGPMAKPAPVAPSLPSVGRLRRYLLTSDERDLLFGDEADRRSAAAALGLPADATGREFGVVFDPSRRLWDVAVESREWPEVPRGAEVQVYPVGAR